MALQPSWQAGTIKATLLSDIICCNLLAWQHISISLLLGAIGLIGMKYEL